MTSAVSAKLNTVTSFTLHVQYMYCALICVCYSTVYFYPVAYQCVECKTNIPLYIHYIAVLSWDTIARIATVTFIVQTIINSREISFSNCAPLFGCRLYLHFAANCGESASRIGRDYFAKAHGKKLTVGPAISAGISIKQDLTRDNIADCSMRYCRRLSGAGRRKGSKFLPPGLLKMRDIRETVKAA